MLARSAKYERQDGQSDSRHQRRDVIPAFGGGGGGTVAADAVAGRVYALGNGTRVQASGQASKADARVAVVAIGGKDGVHVLQEGIAHDPLQVGLTGRAQAEEGTQTLRARLVQGACYKVGAGDRVLLIAKRQRCID